MTDKRPVDYQQLFKSLLETIPLPIFVVDRACSICYVNQLGQHLYGATATVQETMLDQVISDTSILHLVQECIRTGYPQRGHSESGNSDIAWKVFVTPLLHETKAVDAGQEGLVEYEYFSIVIEDMAELRRLERVQRDFLANISHELRTPLASVRLLAETLEDAIDTHPDKAQEFVEKIETEVEYLTGLVSELLELSLIESGQAPMTIEPVESEPLVREVMARMLPLAQRHRVRMGTDIQDGKTLVAADSKLITRVLFNLVHNAIKFTPSSGMIVIGTALEPEHNLQKFFVSDTGVGIREQDLPRIFERFYKVDRARAKANFIGPGGGGTGLGLAIARYVVQAHGGHIRAESIVGQGSTFSFTLPVVAPRDLT